MSFSTVQADGYLVVRSVGQPVSFVPADNTSYETGQGVGNGKVVSTGGIYFFNIKNVVENTAYYFSVFAYNGSGININYKQDNPLSGNITSAQRNTGNYYSGINFSSQNLLTDLTNLLGNHNLISYSNYGTLAVPVVFERDTTLGRRVITCEYSGENKIYNPPFDFTSTGYSREHSLPRSWMPTGGATTLPEGADYHNLALTNLNNANTVRSNYPLGIVLTPTSVFLQCKLGKDVNNKTVFEPKESRKGDAARAMFYQILCYNGKNGNWGFSNLLSNGPSQNIQTLIDWHFNDLPDAFEIAKHEYIYSIQNNRNPFIDFPDLVNCIDFSQLFKTGQCNNVGIDDEKDSANNLSIFPNPAEHFVFVEINSEIVSINQISLTDLSGKILEQIIISENNSDPVRIDVSALQAGCYFIHIIDNYNRETVKKIIISQ
jgi:hypothetical protein